ncbi:MAG: anthranilate phosphoribosyltransferase [Gammaproteobacteria bacterium]|nr:anthranilate phosphoribosyltransferase [Gammaproteobacteria bacterium]
MAFSKERLRMRSYLQLVATGPELSKSLDMAQAEDALSLILEGKVDEIQSAILLIALRMKRETDDENIGALNALQKKLRTVTTKSRQILSISDPFNGYLRGLPITAFLPAVLAACGLPTYIHGVHSMGPKYGITAHMILKSVGKKVDLSVNEAAQRLDQQDVGWSYLDQKEMIPELHDLVGLRDTMVKRTCLSTLEVVLKPISGAQHSHLMTGFVHKAYPPVYCQLAKQVGYDSAIIVRGVEGGCIPSLSQVSRYFGYADGGELKLYKLAPQRIDIQQKSRMVPIPEGYLDCMGQTSYQNTEVLKPAIEQAAELGLGALANVSGSALDSLVYGAAISLSHLGLCRGLEEGATFARTTIASGKALEVFNAG